MTSTSNGNLNPNPYPSTSTPPQATPPSPSPLPPLPVWDVTTEPGIHFKEFINKYDFSPLDLEACKINKVRDVWVEPSHDEFNLRQKNYSAEKKKSKSAPPGYKPVVAKAVGFKEPIMYVNERSECEQFFFFQQLTHNICSCRHCASKIKCIRDFIAKHPTTQFMVVVRQVPTKIITHMIVVYARVLPVGEDKAFDKLHDRFVNELSDDFRKTRFKYLPQVSATSFPAHLNFSNPSFLS